MKQTRYSTIVKIVLLLLMVLVLPACVEKAENFDEMEQALLDNYSTPFQERAVLQYGKDAKVVDIEAEIRGGRDAVMPVTYISLSGNLLGTIQVGDEHFEAMYLYKQDEIYSKRNTDKIKQSAIQLFTDMGMEVVELTATDYDDNALFLPDEIIDLKGLIKKNFKVYVKVFVTNNLDSFSIEDFTDLMDNASKKYDGEITFVQLNDVNELEKLLQKWHDHDAYFEPPNPEVYIEESKEYINSFKYFDIEAYMYLDKNEDKDWKFCYQNKDGVLIEKTIE